MSLDVLVVDDSPVMRRMVRRNLDLTGFELGEVREAKNGRDALDQLGEACVDLALVDGFARESGFARWSREDESGRLRPGETLRHRGTDETEGQA